MWKVLLAWTDFPYILMHFYIDRHNRARAIKSWDYIKFHLSLSLSLTMIEADENKSNKILQMMEDSSKCQFNFSFFFFLCPSPTTVLLTARHFPTICCHCLLLKCWKMWHNTMKLISSNAAYLTCFPSFFALRNLICIKKRSCLSFNVRGIILFHVLSFDIWKRK